MVQNAETESGAVAEGRKVCLIPERLHRRAKVYASKRGMTIQEVVAEALALYLDAYQCAD